MQHAPPSLRLNFCLVLVTILLHGAMMALNEFFFRRAEFLQGIGWIYIPAGTRLLCTLLFGGAGTVGLLLTGWAVTFWYYFPGDAVRATIGTFAGAVGPYIVYHIARREYGLAASLANLTPRRLLVCATACSLASPTLHHIWFALHGEGHLLPGYFVMCIGDFVGTLIVLYTAKGVLALVDRYPRPCPNDLA